MNFPSIRGYEIISTLGEGGMGTVYLARQLSLSRLVAIKVLSRHLATDQSYVKRFHREAGCAAKIRHTGIVQIYDAGEDNGLCYFVMEYVDGETTGRRVRRKGRLDEASALLICESVAVSLEHAWSNAGMIHRDLKPDNILIDSDGAVKVVDLGLAKLLNYSSPAITISMCMIGTPYYCSPEQARGELAVDFRSDIYSLGATLYHFLTGNAPFSDTSGVAAMIRNVTDYIPDPMDCHPDISEPAAWMIEKMMAKDMKDRHQRWSDVLHDFDRVLAGKFPLSHPTPAGASTVLRGSKRAESGRARAIKQPGPRRRATSLRFRIFLAIASAFTIALYIAWFRAEYQNQKGIIEQAAP